MDKDVTRLSLWASIGDSHMRTSVKREGHPACYKSEILDVLAMLSRPYLSTYLETICIIQGYYIKHLDIFQRLLRDHGVGM